MAPLAKALGDGVVFQKNVSRNFFSYHRPKEPTTIHRVYYKEGWSSFLLPSILILIKRSSKVVGLVLGPYYGDSYTYRSQCSGQAPKED